MGEYSPNGFVNKLLMTLNETVGNFREFVYMGASVTSILYAYLDKSSVSSMQGENYFAIKAALPLSIMAVMGCLLALLTLSSIAVEMLGKQQFNEWMKRNGDFAETFSMYSNVFRRHVLTLLSVSALFILFDRNSTERYSTDGGVVTAAVFSLILSALGKLLCELHTRYEKTDNQSADLSTQSDDKKNAWDTILQLLPALVVSLLVFSFNEFNTNGFTESNSDNKDYASRLGIQITLICYFVFNFVSGTCLKDLKIWALASTYVLLVFGVWNLEVTSSETASISLLGLLILDIANNMYSKENAENDMSRWSKAIVSRCVHLLVGIASLILLYVGMEDEEGTGIGDNLNNTNLTRINKEFNMTAGASRIAAQNHTGINDHIELPAAVKIMRDVAFVSAIVKILGILFFAQTLKRFSAEATLRQMSTIGLLLSSSFVWAYPIVNDTIDTSTDNNLEWVIFLGFAARIADMIQDVYVHQKYEYSYFWYLFECRRKQDDPEESDIETARADNPRSWFVISALGITIGMLSRVIDDSTDLVSNRSDKQTHWDGVLLSALILSVAHLLVALLQLLSEKIPEDKDFRKKFRLFALSRSPAIRLVVTTTVLVLLGMLVSEMGFPGLEGEDQYGLFKAKDAQKDSKLSVTARQWHALGALVSYVIADLVGHVFL